MAKERTKTRRRPAPKPANRPENKQARSPSAQDRQKGISRLLGLITAVLLLLIIGVMVLSQLYDTPLLRVPRAIVARVITPVQKAFASGTDFVADYLRTLKLRSNWEYEYNKLREQVDELTDQAMLANSLQQQLQAYEDLSDEVGRNPGLNGIKASIIGRDTSNYSFVLTLGVGRAHGVRDSMAVVVPGALVGITFDTLETTTKVRGIIDTNCAVAAIIESNRDPGTVSGTLSIDGKNNCRMYYLSYTTLPRPGDLVVTSGMNTGLPKGIPIGKVRESTRGLEDSKQFIVLEPLADFDHLEYVIVYRYQQTATAGQRIAPAQPSFIPLPELRPVPTFIGQPPPAVDPNATASPEPSGSPSSTPTATPTPPPVEGGEDAATDDAGIVYNAPVIVDTTATPEPTEPPVTPSPTPTFSPDEMTVEEDG